MCSCSLSEGVRRDPNQTPTHLSVAALSGHVQGYCAVWSALVRIGSFKTETKTRVWDGASRVARDKNPDKQFKKLDVFYGTVDHIFGNMGNQRQRSRCHWKFGPVL